MTPEMVHPISRGLICSTMWKNEGKIFGLTLAEARRKNNLEVVIFLQGMQSTDALTSPLIGEFDNINLIERKLELEIPVFFLMGWNYHVPEGSIIARNLVEITALLKALHWLEVSDHFAMIQQL